MTLFRLDASIQTQGSASRALGDLIEKTWRESEIDGQVIRRNIGLEPLPSDAWALAVSASRTPEQDRTPDQKNAAGLAGTLVDELVAADAILLTVPLYNFGVSQHLKTWVDLIITDPRMSSQPLKDKHAVLAIVRGGAYGPGTPRDGWDHATAWILRILRDVWGLDVVVVEREFTLVGVNPALDSFADLAAEMHRDAEHLAVHHAQHLISKAA
jgi:FMN-dependent NADH-azoreductase